MSRWREIAAVLTSTCLVLGLLAGQTVAPAIAASSSSTATAPQQLVNQYPLGPQRLCCNGPGGSSGTTGSGTNPTSSAPPVPAAPRRTRTPATPSGHGATGGVSAVLLIGLGILALLVVASATGVYRTSRRTAGAVGLGSLFPATLNGAGPNASLTTRGATSSAEQTWDRSPIPPVAMSEGEEREFRRLDANGDAAGAFNLGVLLHQRADVDGARAAYERAELRGDPDAAFNLGVLLYEADDLDGAEAAWRRAAGRGHVRGAANLLFLSRHRRQSEHGVAMQSEAPGLAKFEELRYRHADEGGAATGAFNLGAMLHQQGDTAGALDAYERAERRGDPDAAFNLGVLLYEVGDLDGAQDAWRRGAERGHTRAAENLEFLLRHRDELEAAGVAGRAGDDR